MNQLGVAILGCGNIARSAHLASLQKIAGVRIVALAEPEASARALALREAPTARATADWREAISQAGVDAVIICLPTGMHADAAVAAFEAGKHVYVEKPLASNLNDARRVLDSWQASGRVGMTGYNYRFHPLITDLKAQLNAGRIGRVLGARSIFSTQTVNMPGWKSKRQTGGGVLLDLASHHIDLLPFLLDDVVSDVFARIDSIESEADLATLKLRMAGGPSAQCFFSLRSAEEHSIELFGTGGTLSVDLYRSTQAEFSSVWRRDDAAAAVRGLPGAVWRRGRKILAGKFPRLATATPHDLALNEFVACVRAGRQPRCDVAAGYVNAAIVDAAEKSAESGPPKTPSIPESIAPVLRPTSAQPADAGGPLLSVILIVAGSWATVRTTVRHLRAQTVRDRIELVVVAESAAKLNLELADVRDFQACRVVEAGPIHAIGPAAAAGVRQAGAPIVAFVEDHSFPEPNWGEALLEAHRGPWAAVGPLILNANPDSATSWADLYMGYGPWIDPLRCGQRTHLPGHNSSYKRNVLHDYGDRLAQMLDAETVLQWDMGSRGLKLFQSAEVRTRHTNFSLIRSYAMACFLNGRVFGSSRAANWSPLRRMFFAIASPLIPAVRLLKIIRDCASADGGGRASFLRALPVLVYGLTVDAIGQMLGYAFGPGASNEKFGSLEFGRENHITANDRRIIFGIVPSDFEAPRSAVRVVEAV